MGRDKRLHQAYTDYGCSIAESDFAVGVHYSTIRKVLKGLL